MTRELLPSRRYSESFDINHGGLEYSVQLGFYPDGRVGEVFVGSRKIGSLAEISARDAAVLLSISLQHGVPPEKTLLSLTHDEEGRPEGITGAILERIIAINKENAEAEAYAAPAEHQPAPAVAVSARETARSMGFTGDQCSNCNSMRMKVAGHCMVCDDCGTTTGCS